MSGGSREIAAKPRGQERWRVSSSRERPGSSGCTSPGGSSNEEKTSWVDSLSPYYDVGLKERRLALLREQPRFAFERVDLADRAAAAALFRAARADRVVHLAAQPGVRHSIEDPHAYVDANVTAFLDVLEGCRRHPVRHLVYASSSSVYGGNTKVPFSIADRVDRRSPSASCAHGWTRAGSSACT
jgi:nucleoside-diphosphate-sugar epimerase